MLILVWPKTSLTKGKGTPQLSAMVANVCRATWQVIIVFILSVFCISFKWSFVLWLLSTSKLFSGISVNALIIAGARVILDQGHYTEQEMLQFGFIKGSGGWQYNNMSKIDANFDKYKFTAKDGDMYEWSGEFMNKD